MNAPVVLHTEAYVYAVVDGQRQPAVVDLTFAYTMVDPYAIQLVISPKQGTRREWLLSRDVLADAVSAAPRLGGQEGDVRVTTYGRPGHEGHDLTVITLAPPDQHAEIVCDTRELVDLLNRTEDLVPIGCETAIVQVQLDAEYSTWPATSDDDRG